MTRNDKTPAQILDTEFSEEFVRHMRNAMVMSYYKYGPIADAYPERVDAIGSLMQRLRKYAESGNTEYLVDAANFAMIEYMRPRHPEAKFVPTDDDGSPGRIALRTGLADKRNNDEIGKNYVSPLAKFRK
ncbi:MAG TPA: hypothetical protein VF274_06405 [Alphaproteobacteria bacterium]